MPELFGEQKPFEVITQAVINRHSSSGTVLAHKLADTSTAEALKRVLATIQNTHRDDLSAAKRNPTDPDIQRRAMDVLCLSFAGIRGVLLGTSHTGVMVGEAERLVEIVRTAPTEQGEMEFICHVDMAVSMYRQLWGDRGMSNLCTMGALTQLIPVFVSRLTPVSQDKALGYFNSVIRAYQSEDMQRAMPPRFRALLRDSLQLNMVAQHTRPSLHALGVALGETGAFDRMATLEDTGDVARRLLTVPDDLHFVGSTGMLLSHWRPLAQALTGSYVTKAMTRRTNVFEISAHGDQEDDDDDATMAPVQTERPGLRSALKSTEVKQAASKGTPRTKFTVGERTDRLETATNRVANDMAKMVDKMSLRVDQLQTHIDDSNKSIRAELARHEKRGQEQSAHQMQTMGKLLDNIASYTPDLRHAEVMKRASSEFHSAAKETQQHGSVSAKDAAAAVLDVAVARVEQQAATLARSRNGPPRRQSRVDDNGFKLSHLPWNDFNRYPNDLKAIYASRDNVRSEEEFIKIRTRECQNCPKDAPNMPHAEGVCPPAFSLCPDGPEKLGPVLAARQQMRICEKLGLKPTATAGTYAALLETATALDGATRGGHADACTFFAEILGADDDASADVFIATAEGMFCHGAQE